MPPRITSALFIFNSNQHFDNAGFFYLVKTRQNRLKKYR